MSGGFYQSILISYLVIVHSAASVRVEKTQINQLYFAGNQAKVKCPIKAFFFDWKKYQKGMLINMHQEVNQTFKIKVADVNNPVTYECRGTSGYDTKTINISIYAIDQNSKEAKERCFLKKVANDDKLGGNDDESISMKRQSFTFTPSYPCFLRPHASDDNIYVTEGDKVRLDCEVSAPPYVTEKWNLVYSWWFQNLKIKGKEPYYMIEQIRKENEGDYRCLVNATIDGTLAEITRRFQVILKGSPNVKEKQISILGEPFTNITVAMNKFVKLECIVKVTAGQGIKIIKWGQKVNKPTDSSDLPNSGSQLLPWNDVQYSLISTSMVTTVMNDTKSNSARSVFRLGPVKYTKTHTYICVAITNSGFYQHRTFLVRARPDNNYLLREQQPKSENDLNKIKKNSKDKELRDQEFKKKLGSGSDGKANVITSASIDDQAWRQQQQKRSGMFFLYILIPSLIIAVCLFAGVYLSLRRHGMFLSRASGGAQSGRLFRQQPNQHHPQKQPILGLGDTCATLTTTTTTTKSDIVTKNNNNTIDYIHQNSSPHQQQFSHCPPTYSRAPIQHQALADATYYPITTSTDKMIV